MIKPKKLSVDSFFYIPRHVVAAASMAIVLAACGTSTVKSGNAYSNESQVVSYQYRPAYGFVRIERIESSAPENAHPFNISPAALRQILVPLKVKGTISVLPEPIFTDAELEEITTHLTTALAKAGPKEDVTFAVTGEHGIIAGGKYSPKKVTTGRIFVRDGKLNVIFGIIHGPYEPKQWSDGFEKPFTPGARAGRIEYVWTILPEGARLADKRADWVIFDAAGIQATTAAPASAPVPASAPAVQRSGNAAAPAATDSDGRYREIESKLNVLNRLKQNGLITEEEYRERRRVILQGI